MLYLVLSPFYVFPSGNPQPADLLMAVLILLVFTGTVCRVTLASNLYLSLASFLGVVILVNLYWWSIYYEPTTLVSILFYAYNIAHVVFLASIMKGARDGVLAATQLGLLAAILIEIAATLLFPASTFRAVGTFNNPNQLGYWGLLVAACWLVVRGDRKLGALDFSVLVMVGFVVAVSLSKAAMIAFGMLLIFAVFGQGLRSRSLIGGFALLAIGSQLWWAMPDTVQVRTTDVISRGPVANVIKRFESLGKHADDSVAGRGYDRMWRYPEYLILGAGEGIAYRLFKRGDNFNELHSTWGTLLFSYGVAGFASFTAMLIIIFRSAPWRHLWYFLPIALYGLTHQGLRFSMLWVFFGLVFGLAQSGGSSASAGESPHRAVGSPAAARRRPLRGQRGAGLPDPDKRHCPESKFS